MPGDYLLTQLSELEFTHAYCVFPNEPCPRNLVPWDALGRATSAEQGEVDVLGPDKRGVIQLQWPVGQKTRTRTLILTAPAESFEEAVEALKSDKYLGVYSTLAKQAKAKELEIALKAAKAVKETIARLGSKQAYSDPEEEKEFARISEDFAAQIKGGANLLRSGDRIAYYRRVPSTWESDSESDSESDCGAESSSTIQPAFASKYGAEQRLLEWLRKAEMELKEMLVVLPEAPSSGAATMRQKLVAELQELRELWSRTMADGVLAPGFRADYLESKLSWIELEYPYTVFPFTNFCFWECKELTTDCEELLILQPSEGPATLVGPDDRGVLHIRWTSSSGMEMRKVVLMLDPIPQKLDEIIQALRDARFVTVGTFPGWSTMLDEVTRALDEVQLSPKPGT